MNGEKLNKSYLVEFKDETVLNMISTGFFSAYFIVFLFYVDWIKDTLNWPQRFDSIDLIHMIDLTELTELIELTT